MADDPRPAQSQLDDDVPAEVVRQVGAAQVRLPGNAEQVPTDRGLLQWVDPRNPDHRAHRTVRDSWRVLRIQSEFVAGFDALEDVAEAVTVFGSAREEPGSPGYERAVELGRLLGEAGFAVITGGGPGAMEATTRARTRRVHRRSG